MAKILVATRYPSRRCHYIKTIVYRVIDCIWLSKPGYILHTGIPKTVILKDHRDTGQPVGGLAKAGVDSDSHGDLSLLSKLVVNRLPVILSITGCIFLLQIIDLPFLPCDALRRTVFVIVILSVRLSVTLVHCVHMVRPTIMISSPYRSQF